LDHYGSWPGPSIRQHFVGTVPIQLAAAFFSVHYIFAMSVTTIIALQNLAIYLCI
ncbi:MAG: hypothetical protein ACI9XB_005407, partial [Gammaproteobacteria bacterium]